MPALAFLRENWAALLLGWLLLSCIALPFVSLFFRGAHGPAGERGSEDAEPNHNGSNYSFRERNHG